VKYLKPFKLNESIEIDDSDLAQIASIVDDFNMTAKEEYFNVDATLLNNTYWKMTRNIYGDALRNQIHRRAIAKENKQGFVVMISDQTETYDGFNFSICNDFLLRLMDLLQLNVIELRINLIGEPGSRFRTYSREDIIGGINMDPISRLWVQFYID